MGLQMLTSAMGDLWYQLHETGQQPDDRPAGRPTSREHLWEGLEQPFTAFGQYGVDQMDLRVFDQDTWWGDRLASRRTWSSRITAFTDALRGRSSYAVLARSAGAPRIADLDSCDWLESTPLIRRLRQLTPKGPR
jgi:hypothetical protein